MIQKEYHVQFDREDDGRWIAEVTSEPGVLVYGETKDEAFANVSLLLCRVLKTAVVVVSGPSDEVYDSVEDVIEDATISGMDIRIRGALEELHWECDLAHSHRHELDEQQQVLNYRTSRLNPIERLMRRFAWFETTKVEQWRAAKTRVAIAMKDMDQALEHAAEAREYCQMVCAATFVGAKHEKFRYSLARRQEMKEILKTILSMVDTAHTARGWYADGEMTDPTSALAELVDICLSIECSLEKDDIRCGTQLTVDADFDDIVDRAEEIRDFLESEIDGFTKYIDEMIQNLLACY